MSVVGNDIAALVAAVLLVYVGTNGMAWRSAHKATCRQDHEEPHTLEDPGAGSSKVSYNQMGQIGLTSANGGLQVWNETFEKWLGPIPKALHGPCCAEFIVSRERIEAHPRCTLPFPLSVEVPLQHIRLAQIQDGKSERVIRGFALFWSRKEISHSTSRCR